MGLETGSTPPEMSKVLLKAAVDQAFNAIVVTEVTAGPDEHRIIYVNPAFCRMTGYSEAELLGKNPRLLQGPLTNPDVIRELRACLDSGRFFRGSTVNYRKDGSPYTVEWNITPVPNETGEITHFVSVQQDLSYYLAVQNSHELLAQTLDATHDGVMITNQHGLIEFANQSLESIMGYSISEMLGQTPAMFKSGEHDEDFYRQLWSTLKRGETFRGTMMDKHKNGHTIHCEETISPVCDRYGQTTHFVCVFKDLTERINEARELRQQATLDELTGLLNRRAGQVRLERAYLSKREGKRHFCMILADIDNFKTVNDTWGHSAGDTAIQAVARLMLSSIRATDFAVRWGGEEFMIILNYCEMPTALELAERIRERMEVTSIPLIGSITLSLGVAEAQNQETLSTLIDRADRALYRAKKLGRNRVCSDLDLPEINGAG